MAWAGYGPRDIAFQSCEGWGGMSGSPEDRYDWLCHGRYQEELRLQLLEAGVAEDSMQLQQLIDDSLRAGISAKELHPARVRLRALHEQEFNEAMLAAAVAGDVRSVRQKLRTGGNCDAQQSSTGHSLWHIAASRGDAGLAEIARSSSTQVDLFDRSGWTPLMLASARHDIVLVQDLLAAQADLTATSSRGEVIVECQDATELEAVERELNDNRRLMNYWEDSGRCLDFGDQLAAGEELLLPTFQKVGGRTVLHTALLRPGLESCRISVLNEVLAQPNAPVNALDDLGYSPLWYAAWHLYDLYGEDEVEEEEPQHTDSAAHGGFVGSSSALLRAGARVSLGNCSCIQAAADSFAKAAAQGEPGEVWLHICRLFSRHGAGDFAEEMLVAEAAIAAAGAYPALEHTPDFEEALEASGAAEALDAGCADTSHVFEMRYNSCLLIHRPPSQLTSAEDAASFASAAQPDFESVAFTLAKMFGGYADVPRKVSASHMTRLSRLQRRYAGDFCYAPGAPIDWAAVVGGLEATLVLPSVSDVYKALAELEESWPFKIRGVWDHLLRRDSSRPSWQDGRSRERAEAEAGDSEQQGSSCEYPAAQKVAVAGVE
ncbi:KIDINS220, partial [Symbiodinium sp. KB8]